MTDTNTPPAASERMTAEELIRRLNRIQTGHDDYPEDASAAIDEAANLIRTLSARAEAAEARAETARAEALEEAAKVCERLDLRPDPNGRIDSDGYMIEQIDSENSRPDLAKSIRALLTAPPPTTKESET